MSERSDEELLAALSTALTPPSDHVTPGEVLALRRAVATRWPEGVRAARPWYRPRVAVAVVALSFVMAGAALLAAATDLERPVRVAADAVGLPVDPPRVTDVRDALGDLERALEGGDRAEILTAAAALREELDDLHEGEAVSLATRAQAALDRAERVTGEDSSAPAGGAEPPPAASPFGHDGGDEEPSEAPEQGDNGGDGDQAPPSTEVEGPDDDGPDSDTSGTSGGDDESGDAPDGGFDDETGPDH